jgi:hypothetical protein
VRQAANHAINRQDAVDLLGGNIEAELANEKLEASEQRDLRRRAELIHWLLAPQTIKYSAEI